MKADEAKWFRLITAKRQQELQGKIREEFNERLTDIIRRGGNLGYRRGSEIEFATKRLVANERAKLDAMKEVLATSGAILTEDLGKWLLHDILTSFDASSGRLKLALERGSHGLGDLPSNRRRGAVNQAAAQLLRERNALCIDLGIMIAEAEVKKVRCANETTGSDAAHGGEIAADATTAVAQSTVGVGNVQISGNNNLVQLRALFTKGDKSPKAVATTVKQNWMLIVLAVITIGVAIWFGVASSRHDEFNRADAENR